MKGFKNSIFILFFVFSVVFCTIRYINIDPIKSSFFLIFSLLIRVPLISFRSYVWFSYFICLLFLRGIFVILVYFSSLSKINFVRRKFVFLSFFVTLVFSYPLINFSGKFLILRRFYYNVYWFQMVFIILVLLIFINFRSYILNFSGALRKI